MKLAHREMRSVAAELEAAGLTEHGQGLRAMADACEKNNHPLTKSVQETLDAMRLVARMEKLIHTIERRVLNGRR